MRKRVCTQLASFALMTAVPLSASARDPAGSTAKVDEARELLAANRSADAIAQFREAVELDPANAAAHNALGSLLNSSGHYAAALPHALKAVELDPNNARFRYNRGVVLAEHGRFSEAVADFDIALAAHPELTYGWLERGAAKMSLNDRAGAWRDWEAAAKADPNLTWVTWYRATGDFLEGRFKEAATGFDRIAEAEPGFAPAKVWQAIAHGRAGEPVLFAQPNGSDWPAPVVQHFLGKITKEELLRQAADDSVSGDARRVGEANYFLAQQALIAGNSAAAADHLRKALSIKSPRHVWRIAAERDLKLLQARD